MKVSRQWLKKFFDAELPPAEVLASALTFHAFEIESVEKVGSPRQGPRRDAGAAGDEASDDVLDVKVTPNRGHDCLSHRGIAKELSAILKIPFAHDPFSEKPKLEPHTSDISLEIEDEKLCRRYIAGYVKGVKVGPSPTWLKERLEAIGQRSINNVVDAANFVMFNTGQPLHAFDAGKLTTNNEQFSIQVRKARRGEKMTALDGKEYELSENMLVIADKNADAPIGIAGVKGGMPAAITEETKDIIIESANFDGVSIRRSAHALALRTDASTRFEQAISPEIAGHAMRAAVDLILKMAGPDTNFGIAKQSSQRDNAKVSVGAGGEVAGFVDTYPAPQKETPVSITVPQISGILGVPLSGAEVVDAFDRLGFSYKKKNEEFEVMAPFERLDITIAEDLVEEVARIVGYDRIPAEPLPAFIKAPELNGRFYAAEQAREKLMAEGYSEVFTSVFAEEGERTVLNKVDGVRPHLRASLIPGLTEALKKNMPNKDLLGLKEIRLFEIGTIWTNDSEKLMVGTVTEKGKPEERELQPVEAHEYDNLPLSSAERFAPFSKFPYIVRDIAMWAPEGVEPISEVIGIFGGHAGALLRNVILFDQFKKDGRISYAFHLVLQSFERTLTDEEANAIMEKIYETLRAKGFEIR